MDYWLDGLKYFEQDTANNMFTEYEYNSRNQMDLELKTVNGDIVSELDYTYDTSGNRTRMRSFNNTAKKWDTVTDYAYDANNRMMGVTNTVSGNITDTTRYHYDNNGNTISEQKKIYSAEGQESSNMSIAGKIGGGSVKLYQYDELNRLVQYHDASTEATYTYGADNLRVAKTVNGMKTDFVWNGQNLAGETKNGITTTYTYDPTGIALSKTNDEQTRYIKDPHGNVIATSKNNSIAGTYSYTAFGNQLESTDTSNPFRYCGEYYDNESGLTYLRNRYYSSNIGRFITEDPAKDGLNWYSYCGNNPVMRIDPLGLVDVMLYYVINDLGGTVSWENGVTTVTLGGTTKSYENLEVINGRSIINNEILDKDFAEYAGQFVHDDNDGNMTTDRFDSEEDAALAFSLTYYGFSISDGYEYGCDIFEIKDSNGNKFYTFYNSHTDQKVDEVTTHTYLKLPSNISHVAYAHTHGKAKYGYYNEGFSGISNQNGKTVGDGYVARSSNKNNYLMTPNKKFKKLDKSWNNIYADSSGVYQDSMEFISNNSPYVTNFN